jgi:cobalamin biosynthesis Co2+ chelatase CbiK
MSACPSVWNISAPTREIFMKFEYSSKISPENLNLFTIYKIMDTLHDKELSIFTKVSRRILVLKEKCFRQNCGEIQNMHFITIYAFQKIVPCVR